MLAADEMKKHKLLTIAGLLISIVLLYFSMKDIRFKEIVDTLKNVDPRFVFMPKSLSRRRTLVLGQMKGWRGGK